LAPAIVYRQAWLLIPDTFYYNLDSWLLFLALSSPIAIHQGIAFFRIKRKQKTAKGNFIHLMGYS